VGHTTNFVQRKHAHKQSCINNKSSNHACKLYEVIRANGGWTNWQMEIIDFFNCADHYAARKKEQEYFIALKATLNSIEPLPKPKVIPMPAVVTPKIKKVFLCETCNIHCISLNTLEAHNETNKHKKMLKMKPVTKNAENAEKFECKSCDFKCCKKSNYDVHILTGKHKRNILTSKKCQNTQFACECGKEYNFYSGLWKHKKKCDFIVSPDPDPDSIIEDKNVIHLLINENKDFKNIILDLVKSNQDLQKQMMEVCKTSNNNNNNNTVITNNNNKTFNMQVFLNEKCKDAMNLVDFINSMTLELSDLEEVGKLGYVEGISNIIIRNLNALDIYKRPIHCSDGKREIMFVKDDNIWEKENSTYDKLRKAIKSVTYKNSALLVPWSEKYPNCLNNEHHLNDVYVQMLGQAMGGRESFLESENKIMKKIAKAVLIEKN
jgi:hypothetical protein